MRTREKDARTRFSEYIAIMISREIEETGVNYASQDSLREFEKRITDVIKEAFEDCEISDGRVNFDY